MVQVSGCIDAQKAHFVYGTGVDFPVRSLSLTVRRELKNYMKTTGFLTGAPYCTPAKDLIFYSADIHSNLLVQQRITVLKALAQGEPVTVITTMGGCMDHLLPLERLGAEVLHIESDSPFDMDAAKIKLTEMGYERVSQVEGSGQFAVRGNHGYFSSH